MVLILMSSVPYKYVTNDKQSFIPGVNFSCDSRTRNYTLYPLQFEIVVNAVNS